MSGRKHAPGSPHRFEEPPHERHLHAHLQEVPLRRHTSTYAHSHFHGTHRTHAIKGMIQSMIKGMTAGMDKGLLTEGMSKGMKKGTIQGTIQGMILPPPRIFIFFLWVVLLSNCGSNVLPQNPANPRGSCVFGGASGPPSFSPCGLLLDRRERGPVEQ